MTTDQKLQFTKMHGCGNDYIFVDGFTNALPPNPSSVAVYVSDRNRGVGGDGLILICPSDVAAAEMRMFNADGSESEMCGNGIRCVAKYLFDRGLVSNHHFRIATGAGQLAIQVYERDGVVHSACVDMGRPEFSAEKVPTLLSGDPTHGGKIVGQVLKVGDCMVRVTCVSMGNPHCIIFADDLSQPVSDDMVQRLGPLIERDHRFPRRINVEFVTVRSPREVDVRVWERGSGETLACGTGASGVCVAGVLTGRTERQLRCNLPGGTLELEWVDDSASVLMTGPAVEVFRGEIRLPQL